MKRYFFDLLCVVLRWFHRTKKNVKARIYDRYFSIITLDNFRDKYDLKLGIRYTGKTDTGTSVYYKNVCFINSVLIREHFIADYIRIKDNVLKVYVNTNKVKTINLHYIEPLSRYYDKDQLTEDLKPKI